MLLEEDTTFAIIGAARRIYDRLGDGFLENVYERALEHECRKAGLGVERQVPTEVYYDGVMVGCYRVDLLVQGRVIIEVKCAAKLIHEHFKQTLNYLKCTEAEVALLVNFGPQLQIKRFVYRNESKGRPG